MAYLRSCRAALGGSVPARRRKAEPLPVPPLSEFSSQLEGTGEREISTTMAFVRVLAALLRDKSISRHIVPIVPDESRTFGMEGMFRQVGIYSPAGQLYQPVRLGRALDQHHVRVQLGQRRPHRPCRPRPVMPDAVQRRTGHYPAASRHAR